MTDIDTLLKSYDTWASEKEQLHIREGHPDHSPSSSEWADNDDEGVELAHALAAALRQPVKVWTCAVAQVAAVVTVHTSEEACFEHLRNTYDPEGMADDEPPVAIVGHLQNEGWLVDIDVHELTRS
jgi:hypothetical protein